MCAVQVDKTDENFAPRLATPSGKHFGSPLISTILESSGCGILRLLHTTFTRSGISTSIGTSEWFQSQKNYPVFTSAFVFGQSRFPDLGTQACKTSAKRDRDSLTPSLIPDPRHPHQLPRRLYEGHLTTDHDKSLGSAQGGGGQSHPGHKLCPDRFQKHFDNLNCELMIHLLLLSRNHGHFQLLC